MLASNDYKDRCYINGLGTIAQQYTHEQCNDNKHFQLVYIVNLKNINYAVLAYFIFLFLCIENLKNINYAVPVYLIFLFRSI